MTAPPSPADPDAYVAALTELHRARAAVARARLDAERSRAGQAAARTAARARLEAERARLTDLAAEVRAPLALPIGAASPDVPPLPPEAGLADLQARLEGLGAAVDEARRVAALPQLLPDWRSQPARAGAVYAPFALMNAAMTVASGVLDATSLALQLWVFAVWPAAAAIVGGAVVARVSSPRLPPDPVDRPAGRIRAYRWLGVVLTWAGWLLPAVAFDQLTALLRP